MITDKETLAFYLAADRFALGKTRKHPKLFFDEIWKFQILLRKCEFYKNTQSNHSIPALFARYRYHRLSVKLGFDISMNVFGPGMKINHRGTLVINGNSRIGKWCDLHPGVCVGDNPVLSGNGEKITNVPTVGDYVFLGPGAKLFGKIIVGDNVMISANAVVNCDVENDKVVFGNPMVVKEKHKKIATTASRDFEKSFIELYPQFEKYLR
jgi:serine O-acetyltransferase